MLSALILAASIQPSINIEIDLAPLWAAHYRRAGAQPLSLRCGIKTVGYRWIGEPGRKVKYLGKTYSIGEDGTLELIASRYSVPTGEWSEHDQFGFREKKELNGAQDQKRVP